MERLAVEAAETLAGAPAQDVIAWASETFGRRLCITSSMTDAVIIHLASRQVENIDVLFLDTGYHFAETIGTRDAVSAVYPVNLINVTPPTTVAEQDAELGPKLYSRNPDLCCYLRKVVPLEQALGPYDAWITGVRREETDSRSDTRVVQWDPRREMVKVNPIVEWSQQEVDDYIAEQRGAGQPAGLRRLPVDRLPAPARCGWRRAPTRAAAAGPGPARPSAASTPERQGDRPACHARGPQSGTAAGRARRRRRPGRCWRRPSEREGAGWARAELHELGPAGRVRPATQELARLANEHPPGAAHPRPVRPPDRRGRVPPRLASADGHRRRPRPARRAVGRRPAGRARGQGRRVLRLDPGRGRPRLPDLDDLRQPSRRCGTSPTWPPGSSRC